MTYYTKRLWIIEYGNKTHNSDFVNVDYKGLGKDVYLDKPTRDKIREKAKSGKYIVTMKIKPFLGYVITFVERC